MNLPCKKSYYKEGKNMVSIFFINANPADVKNIREIGVS